MKTIQKQYQMDLVELKSMRVEYKGKCYRNIFLLMDIFSRFHCLAPLTTKKSSHVKKELQRIYKKHGQPESLESDNEVNSNVRLRIIVKVRK